MKEVFDFILENKLILISILLAVISVVLSIILTCKIFKKKTKLSLEALFVKIPDFINTAEKNFDNGTQKLEFVLCSCIKFLSDQYELSESVVINKYGGFIVDFVESILTTPTKKGR